MDALGIARADIEPKATDHIAEMIDVISTLIAKGHAYAVREGENESVYFAVDTFAGYGKLSKKDLEDLRAGARVGVDERKKSPMDFALWKASKEASRGGKARGARAVPVGTSSARPCRCAILARRSIYMAAEPTLFSRITKTRLRSLRHAAASRLPNTGCITGSSPSTREDVEVARQLLYDQEILKSYDAEVIRLFVLSSHYRSPIEFSQDQLRDAEASLDRYYSTIARIEEFLAVSAGAAPKMQPAAAAALKGVMERFHPQFVEAMDDDFNTAIAVGHLFEMIRELNRFLDTKPAGAEAAGLLAGAREMLRTVGAVLNLCGRTPHQWNVDLLKAKQIALTEEDILRKIQERRTARENKDWAAADALRQELDAAGIVLEDKKDGTGWRVKIV